MLCRFTRFLPQGNFRTIYFNGVELFTSADMARGLIGVFLLVTRYQPCIIKLVIEAQQHGLHTSAQQRHAADPGIGANGTIKINGVMLLRGAADAGLLLGLLRVVTFYCGINETSWNHQRTQPGQYACIAPVYGSSEETRRENRVRVPKWTAVRQDSGAFSDGPKSRLSLSGALDRQIEHGHKFEYHDQIIDRASYDLLIDEVWTNDNRHKRRWSENDAWAAVKATVDAAAYLSKSYNGARVLSAQGVTDKQYLDCSLRVIEWFDPVIDTFGLGGWCISGKMPSVMREPFDDTISLVIPALARADVKRVHIWGVMDSLFLGPLLYLCDDYGLQLSTDSSGPSVRPVNGEWGYKGWRNKNFKKPDPFVAGIFRILHVQETRKQLAKLRQTKFYKPPVIQPKQMVLM